MTALLRTSSDPGLPVTYHASSLQLLLQQWMREQVHIFANIDTLIDILQQYTRLMIVGTRVVRKHASSKDSYYYSLLPRMRATLLYAIQQQRANIALILPCKKDNHKPPNEEQTSATDYLLGQNTALLYIKESRNGLAVFLSNTVQDVLHDFLLPEEDAEQLQKHFTQNENERIKSLHDNLRRSVIQTQQLQSYLNYWIITDDCCQSSEYFTAPKPSPSMCSLLQKSMTLRVLLYGLLDDESSTTSNNMHDEGNSRNVIIQKVKRLVESMQTVLEQLDHSRSETGDQNATQEVPLVEQTTEGTRALDTHVHFEFGSEEPQRETTKGSADPTKVLVYSGTGNIPRRQTRRQTIDDDTVLDVTPPSQIPAYDPFLEMNLMEELCDRLQSLQRPEEVDVVALNENDMSLHDEKGEEKMEGIRVDDQSLLTHVQNSLLDELMGVIAEKDTVYEETVHSE